MTILKSLSSLDIPFADDVNIHVSYRVVVTWLHQCVFLTLSGL